MARFVSSVTSNVQGMPSPATLARLTLLVGPNGAGKTSIVRALRLATEASAEDIAGRSVVRDHSELFQLAPTGATELYAAVTVQDGDHVLGDLGWSIRRDGERVSKTPTRRWTGEGNLRVSWPLTTVREAIAGSADTARKTWLRAVEEGLTVADVRRKLVAGVQEEWDRLASEVEGHGGVEVLLNVSEKAVLEARDANKEAGFYARQAQTAKQGLAPEPTDAYIAHLEAAAKSAAVPSAPRFTRDQLQGALDAAQHAQQALYDEATAALAHYTEAVSILEEWHVWGSQQLPGAYCFDTGARTEEGGIIWATAAEPFAIGTEPQPPLVASEEDRLLLAISDLASYQIQTLQQDSTCSLCGTELTPEHWHHRLGVVGQILAESEEGRQAAVVAYETALAEWQERKQAFTTFHHELAAAKRAVEEALEAYNSTVDQYEAKGQLVTATQAELEAAPETIPPAGTSSNELIAAVALRENYRQVRNLEAKAAEAEARAHRWEALASACKTAQAEVMASGIAAFEAKVTKYLPDGWAFKLHPQTMRPGLIRPGRGELPLTALSGGEWAAVTIAMAAAMASPDADLVLLVPEDRAWDPVTLAAVMRGLSKAPGQVILTSTVEPRGKTPAGWTVVQVGEAPAEPKAEPKPKPPKAPPEVASAEPAAPAPEAAPKPVPTRRVVDNPSGKAPPDARASSAPILPRHNWTETEREDFWALGYDERQITRLKEEAGRKILAEHLAAEDVSVLPTGDFVRVVPGGQ